jgi:hypothetical protein
MAYVTRNAGMVNGVFQNPIRDGEELPDDHPDVIAYLNPSVTTVQVIQEIEQKNPITHRALRELILTIGEAFPAGKNTVFYQRVLQTELAIQVERAKL